MRNFKHYITFVLIFVVAVAAPMVAFAQSVTLADANDVFYISSPTPNSWVKGTVQVRWRVYDDDQASVGYEMTLESTSNCAARLGTIATGSAASNAGSDVVTNWNTGGPLLDIASVSDGNYCLRTCVSLRNGTTPYSACAQRIVTVRNHNLVPQFTTFPSNTTILQPDYWQFDINANDGNGDTVIYRLVAAPSFLRISQQSGLIYTSGNKTPGNYNVTVSIDDGYGGVATRAFTLTVAAPAVSSSATSSTGPTTTSSETTSSESSSTSASPNQVAIIKFVKPDAQTVFTGKDNTIAWEATDADGIKSIVLQYSDTDGNLKDIAALGADVSEYNWDVSKLAAGDYTLQLKVEDNLGQFTALVSPKFAVDNNPGTEPGLQSEPLITQFKPGEGEQTAQLRPEISAEFTPPQSKTIDTSTFKFFLDNEDQIGWCEVTEQGFKCTPKVDLELGLHKVNAEIKSSDGKTAKAEWTFSVVKEAANNGGFPTEFDINGQKVPVTSLIWVVVICLLALVLLLIPWFLYLLWRRREERKTEVVVQPEPTTPPDYYAPTVSYSTPGDALTPNVTTNYYYTPEAFDGNNLEIQPVVEEQPVVRDTNYAAAEPVAVEPVASEPASTDGGQPSTAELEAADAVLSPDSSPTPNPDSSSAFVEPPPFSGNDPLAPATSLPQTSEPTADNAPATPDWLNPVGAGSNPLPPATNTTSTEDLGSFGYGRKADDGSN